MFYFYIYSKEGWGGGWYLTIYQFSLIECLRSFQESDLLLFPSKARPKAECSSGIWTALNRSVDEKKYTAHHPPPTKRYTLCARDSPKILKPTKYFKGNSFVKLKMISICRIFFAGISPKKNENFPIVFGVPPKTYPPKNGNFTFFWSTPRKF